MNAKVKVLVIFYSTYGHNYKMAKAAAEGAESVDGADVTILQVPELISPDILEQMGAAEAKKAFAHIPVARVEQLAEADAIIFGTPTRYGNMAGQMRNFLDQTGSLWMEGALTGKVGSVFTSSGTQHGGQETTITSFHSTLLHHGMVIVGLPYSIAQGQRRVDEITGGSPYGASTIAGPDGSRQPSENELDLVRIQARHATEIAKKLAS
ncbi:MAG: NAD(P)H:quinone oxidoreductase [Deltaproteobacteria bacterium]|nr:MAG: NAD(P)H:quinone oxidoreductase [Deltaproteobacteria bacterium]